MLKYFLILVIAASNLVFAQQITTTTLYASVDTYIDNISTSTSYGSANPLNVTVAVNGSSFRVRRTLIYYNLSSIPTNAVITNAEIRLNCSQAEVNVSNTSIKLERVDPIANPTLWGNSVTWATQPTTITSDLVSQSNLVSNYRTFDVSNHVRNMCNGVYQNYGWMVKMVNENAISSGLYSANNTSFKPQLVVSYYIPYSISSATIVHATSTIATNGSISVNIANGPSPYALQWYEGQTNTEIGGATSNTLSNIKYGWYGLRITGSHGQPFYMAFLVGVNCQNATINFNPDANYFDDVVANELSPETNFQNLTTIESKRSSITILGNTIYYNTKSYLKPRIWYDPLINFTAADLVLKGSNHFYTNRSNEAEINIVTQNWNENTLTWSNMPNFSSTTQSLIPATVSTTENKTISILPFVNIWKTNNSLNFGMLLQLQSFLNPTSGMTFHSSDAGNSSNFPSINYSFNLNNISGCNPASINDLSFSLLKENLDASFARTYDGKIKFSFYEYQTINGSRFLPFKILNDQNELVASSDLNGNVSGTISPLAYTGAGNNNCTLDISNVTGLTTGKYFTLIVTTITNETKYLKVFYQN